MVSGGKTRDKEVVEEFDGGGVGSVGVDDQVVGLAMCRNSRLLVSVSCSFCCWDAFCCTASPKPPTRISLLSRSSPMFPPLLQCSILPNLCSDGGILKWSHRTRGSVHSLFNCLVLVDVVVVAERSAIRWVVKMWAEEKNPRDRWVFPAIGQAWVLLERRRGGGGSGSTVS